MTDNLTPEQLENYRTRTREYSRMYYHKNKEAILEKAKVTNKLYYIKNKDKIQKNYLEYYKNNRELLIQRQMERQIKSKPNSALMNKRKKIVKDLKKLEKRVQEFKQHLSS